MTSQKNVTSQHAPENCGGTTIGSVEMGLFAPVPFSKGSGTIGPPRTWSSVKFRDKLSLFEKPQTVTTFSATDSISHPQEISSSACVQPSKSTVPWRVSKPRPPPPSGDGVVTSCNVPLAVVAPLNSVIASKSKVDISSMQSNKRVNFGDNDIVAKNFPFKKTTNRLVSKYNESSSKENEVHNGGHPQILSFPSVINDQKPLPISESPRTKKSSIPHRANSEPTVHLRPKSNNENDSVGPKRLSKKIDEWYKEAQRSKSAERESSGPVWARERTPLHGHIQKTKNFYAEVFQNNSSAGSPLKMDKTEKRKSNSEIDNQICIDSAKNISVKKITSKGVGNCSGATRSHIDDNPFVKAKDEAQQTKPNIPSTMNNDTLPIYLNSCANNENKLMTNSVHCGGGRQDLTGGVMEDGAHMLTSQQFSPHTSLGSSAFGTQKLNHVSSSSLPCYYRRTDSGPHSFSGFPFNEKSKTSQYVTPSKKAAESDALEKKALRFLGGLFRRKKKEGEEESSLSSSDSDGFNPRKPNKNNKRKDLSNQPSFSPNNPNSLNPSGNQVSLVVVPDQPASMPYLFPESCYGSSPRNGPNQTGSLGRDTQHYYYGNQFQSLGIPQFPPQQSNLKRLGVSISHDSLPASAASWNSESAYGSINSASLRSGTLGMGTRSSSTDTLTRRERRVALKAKVERFRDKHKGSSSDEDRGSISSQYGSESSLSMSSNLGKRTRAARTERYLRRKSHELETLRIETEKDRKNKEAVQARILEIQKSQRQKEKDKPQWSAKLVYQVSHEFDSVTIRTPPESPASSHRIRTGSVATSMPQTAVCQRKSPLKFQHPPVSMTTSLNFPDSNASRRSFQEYNSSDYGNIQGHRSMSYDSNINKPMHLGSHFKGTNSSGQVPPAPPPRDMARLFSPKESLRPISYSFECLSNGVPENNTDVLSQYHNAHPVPYSEASTYYVAKSRSQVSPFTTNAVSRSFSEKQLFHPANTVAIPPVETFPSRPTFPKSYFKTNFQPYSFQQSKSSIEMSPQSVKIPPVTCTAPSPSSDYSSYASENSPQLNQSQKLRETVKNNSSHSSSPKEEKIPEYKLHNIAGKHGSTMDRTIDSDSSHSSSRETKNKQSSISTALKRNSSIENESKIKPPPPKRNSSSLTKSSRELLKYHLKLLKEAPPVDKTIQLERQKWVETVYQKEKERLRKGKCANFEEALKELEDIYNSLNLNCEDIMEGAERLDHPIQEERWKGNSVPRDICFSSNIDLTSTERNSRERLRRSSTPDKRTDDLHYRRCQMSKRSTPVGKKKPQKMGSYLLVSPAHVTPVDIDTEVPNPKPATKSKEPDVVYDDYLYRNIQRANSIKVIDPQPPFGIPLGPVSPGNPTDYLSLNPTEEISSNKNEPDIITDDMAYRNLRKDDRSLSNKSLNTTDFDDLLNECGDTKSRRRIRSASADRATPTEITIAKSQSQTPRKVKHQNRVKKGVAKFYESYKEAITDSEAGSSFSRKKPSWVERANLDNKWGSCNTSTETLTELSSVKAVSQPDIRQAIIKESKSPTGGPEAVNEAIKNPLMHLKVKNIRGSSELKKPYKPLDAIFNSKPKPFYLTKDEDLNTNESRSSPTSPVDITQLDDIISNLSTLEGNDNNAKKGKKENISNAKLTIAKGVSLPMARDSCDKEEEFSPTKERKTILRNSPVKESDSEKSKQSLENKRARRIEYEKQRKALRAPLTKKTDNTGGGRSSLEREKGGNRWTKGETETARREKRITPDRDKLKKSDGGVKRSNWRGKESASKGAASSKSVSSPKIFQESVSRLSPGFVCKAKEKMVEESSAITMDKTEADRRDRIQRYKEERRRQMAARYGAVDISSSDEESAAKGGTANRRRRKLRFGAESSSTDVSTGDNKRVKENGSLVTSNGEHIPADGSSEDDVGNLQGEGKGFTSKSRTTNGASSIRSSPPSLNSATSAVQSFSILNSINNNLDGLQTDFSRRNSQEGVLQRLHQQEPRPDSADSTTPSGSDGRGRQRRTPTGERDKSYKRKSNLNRAPSCEEAVYTTQSVSTQASDSSEDVPRRRRRRTPVASSDSLPCSIQATPQDSMRFADPVNHVSRLTPPSSPSVAVAEATALQSKDPLSIGRSAPSTLTLHLKSPSNDPKTVDSPQNQQEEIPNKRASVRLIPLKKPEIPEVLRPKEGSHLTSPGVVNTPPSSRPSSVIFDKPPLAPEGVRPVSIRNSLRKCEGGTCFLASRREKFETPALDASNKTMEENNETRMHKRDELYNCLGEDDEVKDSNDSTVDHQINALTAQARELISRVDMLQNESEQSITVNTTRASNVFEECEEYLNQNKENLKRRSSYEQRDELKRQPMDSRIQSSPPLSATKGLISDTGQKNWPGGLEGSGEKVRRLAFEKEMNRSATEKVSFLMEEDPSAASYSPAMTTVPSRPPNQIVNFDDLNESPLGILKKRDEQNTTEPQSSGPYSGTPPRTKSPILKRKTSREDLPQDRSVTPEPHSILKRKSSSRASSTDTLDSEPKPILKKKNSLEDLDHFEPKPILKKKSLTDDELDICDRPKSILKGARSREDLEGADCGHSRAPILKRQSRDSEDGELRPILKRRDTTDGVRLCVQLSDAEDREIHGGCRVRSDSAPDTGLVMKSHSPPAPSATPPHGILKNRKPRSPVRAESIDGELKAVLRTRKQSAPDLSDWDHTPMRPVSPSLGLLTSKSTSERPLSVAERIAGMEALQIKGNSQRSFSPSPATKRKNRDSSIERPQSPILNREMRRNSWLSSPLNLEEDLTPDSRPPAEAFNPAFGQASKVSQKAAFFAKLEEETLSSKQKPRSVMSRKERGTRFATQPVTVGEVNEAARLIDSSDSTDNDDCISLLQRRNSERNDAGSDALFKEKSDIHCLKRRSSYHELDEGYSTYDSRRGILKSDFPRERQKDSPRSILKLGDSRKSSIEIDPFLRGILKPEAPTTLVVGSPEHHDQKPLKSALKKDSSLEDSREIKSILKPQSDRLDPELSSDSSSEVNSNHHLNGTKDNAKSPPVSDPSDFLSRSVSNKHIFEAAVKQAQPMKRKDDLGEALRQIEPIRMREKSRERRENDSSLIINHSLDACQKDIFRSSFNQKEKIALHVTELSSSERIVNGIRSYKEIRSRSRERMSLSGGETLDDSSSSDSSSASTSISPPSGRMPRSSSQPVAVPLKSKGQQLLRGSYPGRDAVDILNQSPLFNSRSSSLGGSCSQIKTVQERTTTTRARPSSIDRNGEDFLHERPPKFSKDLDALDTADFKRGRPKERPTSLMDRMSQLERSSEQWKVRVSQSDATKFTVAHRMASLSTSSVPSIVASAPSDLILSLSPSSERKKRAPQLKVFKSKTGSNIPDVVKEKSPAFTRKDYTRSISNPSETAPESLTVSIPKPDDEAFASFFSKTSKSHNASQTLDFDTSDFDQITVNSSNLLVNRRTVKVARSRQTTRNPLRSLAERDDVKAEYTEVKLGVGEKELRRMKVEELSRNSTFAMEALAGLASKENFSSVSLKKVDDSPILRELAPYSDLMLIQVKGRRQAQVRMVEPVASSVNSGDDFLLVTPEEVFHYKGEFSNVIERAVASEMVNFILQTKDLGVIVDRKLTEVSESSTSNRRLKFWRLLGGTERSEPNPSGPPEEDDLIETALIASNKIYKVVGDSLIPLEDSWGQSPKYELLSSDKVLLFDFGSEMYLWAGKRATGDDRRLGVSLLKELWQEDFDYSGCDINPIFPRQVISKDKIKGSRPSWGICGKLTENVETILFKQKFVDWPDMAQQSKLKEVRKELDVKSDIPQELEPCDVAVMINTRPSEPDLILEMSHLGRGKEYYDEEERRLLSISTNNSKVWHISENEKEAMNESSFGHLHSEDTYVIRWYYHVTSSGRTLQGTPSKYNVTGRSRVAYFFWQGKGSSISDKGVSALMTVELDEERGPHIRVLMGSEPPAFLNLFSGSLVIHSGKKDNAHHRTNRWRLFIVRGETECEGHLVEVDLNPSYMRSRGCLVLIHATMGLTYVWFGCKVLRHIRQIAITACNNLVTSTSSAIGWQGRILPRMKEEYEGAESQAFLKALGCDSPLKYFYSMSSDERPADWTPRFWKLETTHHSLNPVELYSKYRSSAVSPFPVWQEELYESPQPGLFLVDSGYRVWVWQGWWPDTLQPEDESSNLTGSASLRFTFARRAALKTALNYAKHKMEILKKRNNPSLTNYFLNDTNSLAILVIAGMEPMEFTNLFPVWKKRPDVAALQEKEGRWKPGIQYSVEDVLRQLSRMRFPLEELLQKPLPDGVDSLRLERYLSDEEFLATLGVDRRSFYGLQSWKQIELKKKANLF